MILSWNIRGLNSPLKQSELRMLIAKHMVFVLGILETRVKEEHVEEVWPRLNLNEWKMVHNYSLNDQGRIWIMYDTKHIKLLVLEMNSQFIHCQISWGEDVFLWTCVYGSYIPNVRKEMWRELTRIGNNLDAPWLIQGDFNSVSNDADRIGGNLVNKEAASEFQNWILGLNLVEVQRNDPHFTWTNYQEGDNRIYRKLDWCFANQFFYSRKNDPVCTIINNSISDHCGILVDIKSSKENVNTPFRFFNMWCEHPNFFKIVERIWNMQIRGCHMYRIYYRLKLLKAELKCLNRREFANISEKVSQCRHEMEELRSKLLIDPFNVSLQQEEKSVI